MHNSTALHLGHTDTGLHLGNNVKDARPIVSHLLLKSLFFNFILFNFMLKTALNFFS